MLKGTKVWSCFLTGPDTESVLENSISKLLLYSCLDIVKYLMSYSGFQIEGLRKSM
jgi:hypothetical protein